MIRRRGLEGKEEEKEGEETKGTETEKQEREGRSRVWERRGRGGSVSFLAPGCPPIRRTPWAPRVTLLHTVPQTCISP